MRRVTFNVTTTSKKETPGRSDVLNTFFEKDGKTIVSSEIIGEILKIRSAGGYVAFVFDETAAGGRIELGSFKTKSGAGHAILKATLADERAEKAAKRAEVAQAKVDAKAVKVAAKAAKIAANA